MNEIVTYIENCRKKGFSDRYIKKVLKDAGHQEFVIKRSFSMTKKPNKLANSRNVLYSVFIIISIATILSFVFLMKTEFDNTQTTGQAIMPSSPFIPENVNNNDELLRTKDLIIQQQVDMINELDLSVDEKNILIVEQTRKINELFDQIDTDRTETVNASLELINSILSRK